MSQMYGKRRVVLKTGRTQAVVVCGSDEASANQPGKHSGHYHPLGHWYKEDGLFYVDLQKPEAWYGGQWNLNKRLAGVPTKAALRAFVMAYYEDGKQS